MQTNTQEQWEAFIYGYKKTVEPEKATLQDFLDLSQYIDGYEHNKTKWSDLPVDEKIRICTHQSGRYKLAKLPGGHTEKYPIYCNLCQKCFEANAKKLRAKVDRIASQAEESEIKGQWRKKIVSDDTEAKSLKKHINRNQEGRYFEIAASESTNEIYVYVVDEPGKDMDKIYGEPANPQDVDHNTLYRLNRETGKKFSTGKSFKNGPGIVKENTIRVNIPQIIVADTSRQDEAELILLNTNYLERADTPERAKELYNYQLKYILEELDKADIRILAVDNKFYNFEADQLLLDWNNNVNYWLSILASQKEIKREGNVDNITNRLYHKVCGEPETLEQ